MKFPSFKRSSIINICNNKITRREDNKSKLRRILLRKQSCIVANRLMKLIKNKKKKLHRVGF